MKVRKTKKKDIRKAFDEMTGRKELFRLLDSLYTVKVQKGAVKHGK